MTNIVNAPIVLVLNGEWKRIGWKTVKDAFIDLAGGSTGGKPKFVALDMDFATKPDGELDYFNMTNVNPVTWDEWINLPIRDWDLHITGAGGRKFRVPLVVVASNYKHLRKRSYKGKKPSSIDILRRDGFICQYTGKQLTKDTATVDHVIPKSRGGGDTWENLAACEKGINTRKSNKLNHEIGLKLIKQPTAPKEVPISETINEPKRNEHIPFILDGKK